MAVFVVVAAVSAGGVASVTYALADRYRWQSVRSDDAEEARIALTAAPETLDARTFERLEETYEQRTDADLVAIQGDSVFSSRPTLSRNDIPAELTGELTPGTAALAEAEVRGEAMLVVRRDGPGGARYYFFFSMTQVRDSLAELRRAATAAWLVVVFFAGAVGHAVARATLRPVAATAAAAESIADGDLHTRLPVAVNDEFGALAASFNHMADAVSDLVARLEHAAGRERRFTADVAHELRTPLTGMIASAAVLRELQSELPSYAARPVAVLVSDVERLRDLVFELLELSRLDAGTDPVDVEPLRLADAVTAVCTGGGRRDANVDVRVAGDIVVQAEPRRLRRILGNLLDNAVHHGAGRPELTARRDGKWVVVDIVDDGPGIRDEDLPRVFGRFFKSDASRASGGSGLGLAIAREHARAQGGDVTVTNAPGRGARFSVRLLAENVPDEPASGMYARTQRAASAEPLLPT